MDLVRHSTTSYVASLAMARVSLARRIPAWNPVHSLADFRNGATNDLCASKMGRRNTSTLQFGSVSVGEVLTNGNWAKGSNP